MLSRTTVGIGALIALALTVNGVLAKQQTPHDTSVLLTEIRLMRQSIDAMAANHLRVQVLVSRLQAQQMPAARAAAMLQTARANLASLSVRYDDMQDRVSQLETMANDPGRTPEDVQNLLREARTVRAEATRLEDQRSSLQMMEAEAARQNAEEQARLTALNAQIEELERTVLAPRRP